MKKYCLILTVLVFTISSFEALASFPTISIQKKIITQADCDNIILKDGKEISAQVLEVSPDLIKYKKCNNLDGPLFSINKSDVIMIRYSDGKKDIIEHNNYSKGEKKRFDIFGVLALPFAVAGLFWGGIIFGPVAIILGIIGVSQKNRQKILSILGLAIGTLVLILWIILLSLYF